MIALTSLERMDRATSRPGATFADALEVSILLEVGTSPVLERMIDIYDWPRP
ncbi:hypothetical protein [Streptomyces sp. MST-110588]|uniref:hypothetical protein n=1 Tax=Streptomyces sp. MST-110588 TaxID=2833628 RepID=UPI001F5C9086|nr:hypothetical protein [Streptomyces sp. MST-110588]UNO38698.1 hypothetical protein KGS77_02335 [Streptomyces sp. MST-110588]